MARSGYDILWKGTMISIIVLFFSVIFHDLLTWIVFEQCNLSKFPLIYGVDGCNYFVNRSVNLKFELSSILLSLVSSKSVYYASMGAETLIFKKQATKQEFKSFDEEHDYTTKTSVNFTIENLVEMAYIPEGSAKLYKLRVCPGKKSLLKFIQVYNNTAFQVSKEHLIPSLWTLLNLNPEPLILTLLKPPDWPVPKFYGSCGRLSVFEYCGTRLTNLLDAPFKERLNISYQILNAALKFTFDHSDFAFYLTDVSPDNIVVNNDGGVRFIDLDNIILVQKNPEDISDSWLVNHTSKHQECKDCFSFSPDDICSHQYSDHNIYAVCKELFMSSNLLPNGFLHSMPKKLPMRSYITDLLHQCLLPTTNTTRFLIANQLIEVFKTLLHSLQFNVE